MSETEATAKSPAATFGRVVIGFILIVAGYFLKESIEFGPWPINLGVTVTMFGVALVTWGVIESFYTKPFVEILDNRNRELEGTFAEVEDLRNEMTQMKANYEKQLAETEAQARAQIQEQIKEATDLKNQLKADAQRQVEDYKRTAMAEIDAEKNKVMTELRVHVANLSMQATEKILGANIDKDRNRQLVDEFLDTVEVKN